MAQPRNRARWPLLLLWAVLGVAVWSALFDIYVSRGAREYLQLVAESELGRRATPSMAEVMSRNKRAGATAASYWALIIIGAGWATVYVAGASRRKP